MSGSLRAYAKHRQARGLTGGTLRAVQKQIAAGRIETNAKGQIEFESSDRAWAENTRKPKSVMRSPVELVQPHRTERPTMDAGGAHQGRSLADAERELEWLKVRQAQLKLAVQEGELVPLAEINAFVAGGIIKARDIFLRIGPELRDRLAAEQDPLKCEGLIVERVERGLAQLAEFKASGQ